MYRRLAGRPPFWNRKQMLMLRQIVSGDYTFGPEWEDISSSAKDLVRATPDLFCSVLSCSVEYCAVRTLIRATT